MSKYAEDEQMEISIKKTQKKKKKLIIVEDVEPIDIAAMIKKSRPTLSDASIRTYIQNIKKVSPPFPLTGIAFLSNTENVFEKIDTIEKVTMKRNILSAVLVLLQSTDVVNEELIKTYKQKLIDITNSYKLELAEHQKTEVQSENWTTMAVLTKITKSLLKQGINQNSLVAALYTLQPPVRLDYFDMQIVDKKFKRDDSKNYLVVYNRDKKVFVFGEYKTKTTFGIVEIPVAKPLNNVINKFLKLNQDRKYLLEGASGVPLTRNALGKTITRVFEPSGKKITLNQIRHIVASESVDIKAIDEAKTLAGNMLHSSGQQMEYAKLD